MGGGTDARRALERDVRGLSPRGRGNLIGNRDSVAYSRSIPAWAGEPPPGRGSRGRSRVYPRVGGGTHSISIRSRSTQGLSPRGRGNPRFCSIEVNSARSIPAWAGEPPRRLRLRRFPSVYPRVGGGTVPLCLAPPRRRGLSPRGRGNLIPFYLRVCRDRSIPAWAGEPPALVARLGPSEVYPRVGGGTCTLVNWLRKERGLSPRGRGNRQNQPSGVGSLRSIPAWAGEPASGSSGRNAGRVYPRVGGGTGPGLSSRGPGGGLSPRGRGNRPTCPLAAEGARSIPAWAGEPSRLTESQKAAPVYPRVGGGTTSTNSAISAWRGLSPRGRGNLEKAICYR